MMRNIWIPVELSGIDDIELTIGKSDVVQVNIPDRVGDFINPLHFKITMVV